MGKLVTNDPFLSHVSKLGQKFKEKGIIRITIKRDLTQKYPELKKPLRHKQRNELIASIKQSIQQEQVDMTQLVVKVTSNDSSQQKMSTNLNQKLVTVFSNQLSNIFRLWCFQRSTDKNLKKNVLKATPCDPKSKRYAQLKDKKRRNQERRKKKNQLARESKREKQRQHTFSSKMSKK